jgi:hypothetical protein
MEKKAAMNASQLHTPDSTAIQSAVFGDEGCSPVDSQCHATPLAHVSGSFELLAIADFRLELCTSMSSVCQALGDNQGLGSEQSVGIH